MNKQLLRIKWQTFKFELIERIHDLFNVAMPVFLMVGMIGAAVRFWSWVYGFNL